MTPQILKKIVKENVGMKNNFKDFDFCQIFISLLISYYRPHYYRLFEKMIFSQAQRKKFSLEKLSLVIFFQALNPKIIKATKENISLEELKSINETLHKFDKHSVFYRVGLKHLSEYLDSEINRNQSFYDLKDLFYCFWKMKEKIYPEVDHFTFENDNCENRVKRYHNRFDKEVSGLGRGERLKKPLILQSVKADHALLKTIYLIAKLHKTNKSELFNQDLKDYYKRNECRDRKNETEEEKLKWEAMAKAKSEYYKIIFTIGSLVDILLTLIILKYAKRFSSSEVNLKKYALYYQDFSNKEEYEERLLKKLNAKLASISKKLKRYEAHSKGETWSFEDMVMAWKKR